jgi:magnesium chelatase family protein
MSIDEALEVTKIYSVAGLLPSGTPLVANRPFRAPHHTVSYAGLVGGGKWPRPGEVSLAHRGVLFLDELPEFDQRTLEVMRQPLEDRVAAISRVQGTVTFPANFTFIAAMNPCPCGYRGDPKRDCTCSESMVTRYSKRISGPLLDRIDIHIEVPRIEYEKLADDRLGETSASIRGRVESARQLQRRRFSGLGARPGGRGGPPLRCNADMGPAEIRLFCLLDAPGNSMLRAAMNQMHLSARAFHRILKLARTIADLAGSTDIRQAHLAEAIQYRPRGKG